MSSINAQNFPFLSCILGNWPKFSYSFFAKTPISSVLFPLDFKEPYGTILGSKLHFSPLPNFQEVFALNKHYGRQARILHWCTEQAITKALEEMELTSAQGQIMGFLARAKTPPCPKDIEEAFHLSHPTVSGLLSRLERKGFIALHTDEKDRRCKRILVLPKGQECQDTMRETILHIEEQLVAGFSQEEKALFMDFMERAITNMGGYPTHHKPKEETTE